MNIKSRKEMISNDIDNEIKGLANSMLKDNAQQGAGRSVSANSFFAFNSAEIKTGMRKSIGIVADDLMFRYPALSTDDFRRTFGYDFMIYDIKNPNHELYVLNFQIPPTNISVSVPSASSVSVTMKGIIEEHNGAPLHQITLSGTTGVARANSNGISKVGDSTLSGKLLGSAKANKNIAYALKNTIKAVDNVGRAFARVQSADQNDGETFSGPLNHKPNQTDLADIKLTNATYPVSTGFSFAHSLARFLDLYLSLKKRRAGSGLRLMFRMYKDGGYYSCSLNNYSLQKNAGTLEYNYTISLTAWRKHNTPRPAAMSAALNKLRKSEKKSQMAAVLNTIRESRRAIASIHGVLRGIRGDLNDSFIQPMAEIALLLKDAQGVVHTLYDFTWRGGIIKELKEAFMQQVGDTLNDVGSAIFKVLKVRGFEAASTSSGKTEHQMQDALRVKKESGLADQSGVDGDKSDIISKLFVDMADYPEIFDDVSIPSMNISLEAKALIQDEVERIRKIDIDGIIERRDKIADFAVSISQALGGNSDSYNRVNGLSQPRSVLKKLSTEDIEILAQLNTAVMEIDSMIAGLKDQSIESSKDYYSFYVDYAVTNGLAMSANNVSKFFVPFPTGSSIESLALQYLGSADKWLEIAALNALRAPYVDEDGFFLSVIASAGGNTLTVPNADNLYVGQIVDVMSNTKLTIRRKIRSINIISAAEVLLAFEPASDGVSLAGYKPADAAKVHAHLPHTVNSNMLIAIPSSAAPDFESAIKITPGLDEMDKLAQLAQIDFLLDNQGDIIFTSAGDIKLATGLTNLVQAAKLKLLTRSQTLIQHPEFGSSVEAGTSTAEVDVSSILESLKEQFSEDPRFSGILAAEFSKSGPTVLLSILLGIANNDVTLPLSVEMPR